jgi:hypothetical protein
MGSKERGKERRRTMTPDPIATEADNDVDVDSHCGGFEPLPKSVLLAFVAGALRSYRTEINREVLLKLEDAADVASLGIALQVAVEWPEVGRGKLGVPGLARLNEPETLVCEFIACLRRPAVSSLLVDMIQRHGSYMGVELADALHAAEAIERHDHEIAPEWDEMPSKELAFQMRAEYYRTGAWIKRRAQ